MIRRPPRSTLDRSSAASDVYKRQAFDEMLLKVANDDVASFRNNNKWLNYHPSEALIFRDLENVWNELKTIYNGDFKNLVYGELPKEEAILKTLQMIQERMVGVQWLIVNDKWLK